MISSLMDALDTDFTIACPAFPETGRTIFKGHLFIADQLLSNTHMADHPLTPMTDSNLVAVLQRQTSRCVGLVQHREIEEGPDAIRKTFHALKANGKSIAITDAVSDEQLHRIGPALEELKLVTGGSGIALGLPANYRRAGLIGETSGAEHVPPIAGPSLVLSGSCSAVTLEQVARFEKSRPSHRLDPLMLAVDDGAVQGAIEWAKDEVSLGPAMIYASAPPDDVKTVQDTLGRTEAGELVENAMARIAVALVQHGVRRLVVAGGETSGAVATALGIKALRIGTQIDPGVPNTVTIGATELALTLKSGNFGAPDFFEKALRAMP